MSTEATGTRSVVRARPLVHNRDFHLLLGGQFVSQLGDRLAMVAFPWLVYNNTKSTLSTGVILALYTLPYIVFGPFIGVVVDRFDRRRLMVLADVARAVLVFLVPFVASRSLPATFALGFATASFGVLFDPAKMSLLPDVVRDGDLVRANSLIETVEKLTEILGYAAAGFLLAWISTGSAFRIDALTFLISAGALLLMRVARRESLEEAGSGPSFWRRMREGLSYLRAHTGLMTNTVLFVVAAAGVGAVYPLTFFLAVRVFDSGPEGFGTLEAAIGAGYLVGTIVVAAVGQRLRLGPGMLGGLIVMGLAAGLAAIAGGLWMAAVPFAVLGLANAFMLIAVDTYVQRTVPDEFRGRVWGVRLSLTQGVVALAIIVAGGLAGQFSVQALLVVAGLLILVPGVVGVFVPAARDI